MPNLKKAAVWGAIIFFASSLSFALGYLSSREFNHAPIIIEKCAASSDLSAGLQDHGPQKQVDEKANEKPTEPTTPH